MKNTFEGYLRSDGTAGTRNHIGIVSSVICSSIVTNEISEKVQGAIPIVHSNGCAQLGDDFRVTKNMLVGVASNPNLYASLLVGLGCETNQISGLLESIPKTKPLKGIGIQQMAGGKNTIETGISIASSWSEEAEKEKRETLPLSQLKVGVVTVDIDEESLKKMTPVVSELINMLIENDASVVMGLTDTLEPAGDVIAENVDDIELKQKLVNISEGLYRRRWKENTEYEVPSFSNEEKNLASVEAKLIGTNKIKNLLNYNDNPEEQGLHLMKSTRNIVETLSNFASIGCNFAIVLSSRGVLTSSVAIPCMTIAPQDPSASFDELVDYKIDDGQTDQQAETAFNDLLSYASGKQTVLEEYDLGEFSIPHVGTTF